MQKIQSNIQHDRIDIFATFANNANLYHEKMNLLIDKQQSIHRMFNFVINDNFIKFSFVTTLNK